MDRLIDEIVLAWSSLRGSTSSFGWRAIQIRSYGSCVFRAALHFPDGREALLVSFSTRSAPSVDRLPQGVGFSVGRIDPEADGPAWLALTRNPNGSLELFTSMVEDIVSAISRAPTFDELRLLRIFLGRIRAWQEFMRRGAHTLGPEAELGLVGELIVLLGMLSGGVAPEMAVRSWISPFDGLQDFEVGSGAVEVKSSLAPVGFLAKIGSLQQLDDSQRSPLFVAAVRLRLSDAGRTLPEFVGSVMEAVTHDPEAHRLLQESLLSAGYTDLHADQYLRRFDLVECFAVEVGTGFPRLTAASVPVGITWAAYEVNLDAAMGPRIEIEKAFKQLGAL